MGRKLEVAFGALLLVGVALIGWYSWQWLQTTTVSREEDGDVISKVVFAKLADAEDLRVKKLTGIVQGAVCVGRMWGLLRPCRVMKAPFRVDYFVNLRDLDRADFRWNDKQRILIVNAPDVQIGSVNVDESRTTYDRTDGVWVSRGAMAELRKKSSIRAHQVTGEEAKKVENIDQARRSARRALARFFELPLQAAGVNAIVQVVFPAERASSSGIWNMSRPLSEVLRDAR